MPTLQQLMDVRELELQLLDGSAETPFTSVRFPERAGDRPWLAAGDLRLIEGSVTSTRDVVERFLTPPPAGLVYAGSARQRSVPDSLVRHAVELGVPVLSIPPHVNLLRVEQEALRLLAPFAGEAGNASVQRSFLRTLDSAKPERDLLEHLYRLTGGSFVLVAPWGSVVARSGPRSWRGDPHKAAVLPEGPMRIAGRQARALRIVAGGRLRAVLLALDDEAPLALLELTRTLLAVSALGKSADAGREDVRRAALLAEWLAGPNAGHALAPRLRDAGLDLDNPFVVVVAEAGPRLRRGRAPSRQREQIERLRDAGDEFFRSLGLGVLSDTRPDHGLWVFTGGVPEAHVPALHQALTAAADGDAVRLGVGLPADDPTRVADAYRQALLALQTVPEPDGIAHFDAFDPVYWVLRQQPLEHLKTLSDRLVGPLRAADDNGKLWHTLQSYLRSPGDLTALAKELHIHVNTLRYRLRRIEALLHQSLSQPQTLAKLYLADQIDALLDSSAPLASAAPSAVAMAAPAGNRGSGT